MNRIVKVSALSLAAMMVALLAIAGVGVKPIEAACLPPSSCEPIEVYDYCNCVDGDITECQESYFDAFCGGGASACGLDARVNTNCSAPEILYCNGGDAEFYQYNYSTGKGDYHFSIPLADLMASVKVKTLIKQVGKVKVYLNPNGTVELQAPQPDGKIYFMVWDPGQCVSLQESAEWGLK